MVGYEDIWELMEHIVVKKLMIKKPMIKKLTMSDLQDLDIADGFTRWVESSGDKGK
ncbi:MAG: hypothetical protein H3Z50_07775, partial [archaeon]|nr:hypothetical protein [archaeon]